jgi:hypothetical protein
VKVAVDALNVPTFYVQTGSCNATGTTDQLWKFTGTNPAGVWQQFPLPTGGVGVFTVHPADPSLLMASGQASNSAALYLSTDGGVSWSPMPQLDALMTGSGAFLYRNSRGPTDFTGFSGYWQPSLVAFDPNDSNLWVAGAKDAGVFISTDAGGSWNVVTDPLTSHLSGLPHLPRPWYAYFDAEPSAAKRIVIGTQGRGVWRLTLGAAIVVAPATSANPAGQVRRFGITQAQAASP